MRNGGTDEKNSPRFFYFVAQTGLVTSRPPGSPSNFYTYRLPSECRERVEQESNKAIKDMLNFKTGCLFYDPDFLEWLKKKDQQPIKGG